MGSCRGRRHFAEVQHPLRQTRHHTSYRACYRFEVDGVRYVGKQSVASNPPAYRKGEKLTVVYNPAHPYESDVDSAFDLYFKSFAFAAAGLICFLIGVPVLKNKWQGR